MLWIALFLPEWPLQAHHRRALGPLRDIPIVVSDGPAKRPYVLAANAAARAAGIHESMPLTSAQAHASGLVVVPRQAGKEEESLRNVAEWLTQFTPMVALEKNGVVLEVSSSLTLFHGLSSLLDSIRRGLAGLDFHALPGVAPTPRAAMLLARAAQDSPGIRICREPAQLAAQLADLPLQLYDWPHDVLQTCATLGLTRMKDLLAQPRAGLVRRFGSSFIVDLDRTLGTQPDPREPCIPPGKFENTIDLPFETDAIDSVCHAVGLLLNTLEVYLRARGAAVARIGLSLRHTRTSTTRHTFGSRHPQHLAQDWLRLIRERLAAHPLPDVVTAVTLSAERLQPCAAQTASWLPDGKAQQEKWGTLLDRIGSRLGPGRVFTLAAHNDHRPEFAWRVQDDVKPAPPASVTPRARPLLLLKEPTKLITMDGTPHHHGALTLLAGPERIETGWWDGRPVARDYFVASNPRQQICWVYRDYRMGKAWFLHGYFA
jgi:protein ImuB